MMKYRKKPVEVEAFRMGIDNIPDWFMDKITSNEIILSRNLDETYCHIETLEGTMKADYGDYIIRGVNGEIYPCKPDIFEKTYERAEKMIDILLTCIEIAQNKGILFNEKDLDKAKEYVENILDEDELERILEDTYSSLNDTDFLLDVIDIDVIDKNKDEYSKLLKSKEVNLKIKEKLEKQKELLR